ncbi:MAG TPA: hypothetical protein VFE59_35120 [Trebonia sp.]|nr:hypothetical protein [Trebonia sp.]
MISFFTDAGIAAELMNDGSLQINKRVSEILPSRWELQDSRGGRDAFIDRLAVTCLGGRFAEIAKEYSGLDDAVRFSVREGENGIAVIRDGVRLAFIHATMARAEGGGMIRANFLATGPHWSQLREEIYSATAKRGNSLSSGEKAGTVTRAPKEAERRRDLGLRRISKFPSGIDPLLARTCIEASRRIRTERQVAYSWPVVLESGLGELMLLPITSTEVPLLPFRLTSGLKSLEGYLELIVGHSDPLPLFIDRDVSDEDVIKAWAAALVGFADATCIEIDWIMPRHTRPQQGAGSSVPIQRDPISTAPRRRSQPSRLEQAGAQVRHSAAFVGGHRMRLADGKTASDEARERAWRERIILRENETWVRAHYRGIPKDAGMRFRWHPPRELLPLSLL